MLMSECVQESATVLSILSLEIAIRSLECSVVMSFVGWWRPIDAREPVSTKMQVELLDASVSYDVGPNGEGNPERTQQLDGGGEKSTESLRAREVN